MLTMLDPPHPGTRKARKKQPFAQMVPSGGATSVSVSPGKNESVPWQILGKEG